ncbi:type II toxin-antitoxin system RelE/ParE family toxin [Hymenobacter artigasi]|uniref:Plasmid stabilization system protein ParE n=1 Tax=Hymenobacter artigasi TaxID=2719616 RepID=A0ABX1HHI6_9BACT|nr:type II toxin-antitoxin system RelE/ParE family toxin [Hymenobacter artigasi]NKI88496.1 plasmid stabilization system protein ParE [Hymenobacter artigasi]
MAELRLSRRASDEIYEEAERLGAFSPAYARAFIDSIFAKADLLRQFPELGRMVPEYANSAIRELFHRHYRIFYFVSENGEQVSITSVQSSHYPLQPL